MFKRTIQINEQADPAKILEEFYKDCENTKLADPSSLINQVEDAINELSERGSQLASVGSQFNIKRTLEGDDFHVVLETSFGGKERSFLSKLFSRQHG